jgi:1,5-anhydro-D-fructose reductase (1,5-anhydro-D-mannitol-forming)
VRVAILSFWHVHAPDHVRYAQAHPDVDIVGVWDDDTERGRSRAGELGVDWHESLGDVLRRTDVDAVIVDAPTSRHHDVITAAANAGKHIFTEKVLAPTVSQCLDILSAVDSNAVTLMLSLPRLYDPATHAISEVLASGRLGTVTLVRTRLAHGGSVGEGWLPERFYDPVTTGGGALIDLGCHPLYLARLFLGAATSAGLPETVSATLGHITGRAVEDNAVVTLRYPDGVLGIVEAGLVTPHSAYSVEIHGTHGSLLFGTPDPKLLVRTGNDADWTDIALPRRGPTVFERFVTHVQSGTRDDANVAAGLDLTRLIEAAYESARTGSPVPPRTEGAR